MRECATPHVIGTPLRYLPAALVLIRALLGVAVVVAAFSSLPPRFFLSVLVAGFLSDYFDGVIARRLGMASAGLRRADSGADAVFYAGLCVAAFIMYPRQMALFWPGLALVVSLELVRYAFDYWKFRRETAYHMWSAKLWGVTLFLGFGQIFWAGEAGWMFALAIVVGIFTDIEGLLASIVLGEWRHDVPTLYHAVCIARRDPLPRAR